MTKCFTTLGVERYKLGTLLNMKFFTEDDIKKISLKKKSKIKKEIKNKVPKISEAKFDVWKAITKTIERGLDLEYFKAGSYDWGGNRFRITQYFYEKFFKDFKKGTSFETEGQSKKFKENIYNLLKLAENKTPQKTSKDRTFPFKQQKKYGQTYAIPGKETAYSNNHNPANHYYYNYCNQTKIKFFKGPNNQAKQIIDKNWQNLFSNSFIYGYLLASVKLICDLGTFEIKKDKAKFKKNPFTKVIYNKKYIKKIITEFYEKFNNESKIDCEKIYDDIEKSIFNSKLAHFLSLKDENYFSYILKSENFDEETDGIGDFLSDIETSKKKYFPSSKDARFTEVIIQTRKDARINNISPYTLGLGNGCIINYEQFRLYTLSLYYLNPYTEKQLNINKKDIFIRYAINQGVQEILFYVCEEIFSPT